MIPTLDSRAQDRIIEEVSRFIGFNGDSPTAIWMSATTMENIFKTNGLTVFIGINVYKTNGLPDDVVFVGKSIDIERRSGNDRRKL